MLFNDVARNLGIKWNGERGSISVNLFDFNADGLLDIWIAPHSFSSSTPERKVQLYLNQGNETFTEISDRIFASSYEGDTHGASWNDFDNDGDVDLFMTNGGRGGTGFGPSKLFVNEEGILTNRAAELGVEFGIGRVRTATWFDGNNDGLLDVIQVTEARSDGQAPTTFFQQTADGFINANTEVGFAATDRAVTAQTADLFGDGTQDLIILSDDASPRIYETTSSTWNDISSSFPEISHVRDAAIADFNGDGVQDIFLTRANEAMAQGSNSNFAVTKNNVFARLITQAPRGDLEAGISWQTKGEVTFDHSTRWELFRWAGSEVPASNIFLGSQGINPTTSKFTLSAEDPDVLGTFSRTEDSQPGLYIGYDPVSQIWEAVNFNTRANTLSRATSLFIESSAPLIDVNSVGFEQPDITGLGGLSPTLLIYDPETGEYVDKTESAGLESPKSSRSVVSGDFDNDGDVDLYMASSTNYYSLPSTFYENQGDGTFVEINNAAGAEIEYSGPRNEEFNIGINLAAGDYNGDGSLDILAGSSTVLRSDETYSLGSPYYLFENQTSDRNWLQVDLQGSQSNRDGIGTKVFATAGNTTQLRELSSQMHRVAQNQPWLHFGLGENERVDLLRIEWLSGAVQELSNIDPNQLLKVVENQGTNNADVLIGTARKDILQGLNRNDTISGGAGDDRIIGGKGRDLLIGDNGRDLFVLDPRHGTDTIEDFRVGVDKIGLVGEGIIFEDLSIEQNGDLVSLSISGTNRAIAKIDSVRADLLTIDSFVALEDTLSEPSPLPEFIESQGTNEADLLFGSDKKDEIRGLEDNDTIMGGLGDDRIIGGPGNDIIVGGSGNDTLSGNGDRDIFVFGTEDGIDTINDFKVGVDKIGLIAEELTFEDLSIRQSGSNVILSQKNTGGIVATIKNEMVKDFTQDTFIEIEDLFNIEDTSF